MGDGETKKTRLEKAGFKHEIEEEVNIAAAGSPGVTNDYIQTDWPKPLKRFRFVYENFNASIEETYYWILTHIKQDQAYANIFKITDTFTASEQSSMWGNQMQKLGIQQDKVSQYMALIGKMTKELFQIVREVRVLKERLQHYHESLKGIKAADIALKGYWVDLVEGGGKNPGSVYGLASQLGFGTLPDLFFDTFVKDNEDVDKIVERNVGQFNRKVKEVLKRKLYQFVKWRKETQIELENRHKFTLRYLRQHWNSIRLYISWVKPYLKNVKKLQTEEKYRDDAEIVSSMETAMLEIEFLAQRSPIKGAHPVIIAHFEYRVRPAMNFSSEYQRGPIHVGRITTTIRGYAWTSEEIQAYRDYRSNEDVELLSFVDNSIRDAMDALGDDLMNYLIEAQEDAGIVDKIKRPAEEKKSEVEKTPTIFDPIIALAGGFKDMAAIFLPFLNKEREKKEQKKVVDRSIASKSVGAHLYQTYKNYKKSHGMIAW